MDKNALISFPDLLIWLPLVAGLVSFMLRKDKQVKAWSLFISIITLLVSVTSLFYTKNQSLNIAPWSWIPGMGAGYTVGLDGIGGVISFFKALALQFVFADAY